MAREKNYTKDELFDLFVANDGDYKKVSKATGISTGTLYNYSSRLDWVQRLEEMDERRKSLVSELTKDSALVTSLLETEIYRGMSNKILEVLNDSLPLLEASKNPKDLKTLLDIYRVINSQPTEITQEVSSINTDNFSDAELVNLASALAKAEREKLN